MCVSNKFGKALVVWCGLVGWGEIVQGTVGRASNIMAG